MSTHSILGRARRLTDTAEPGPSKVESLLLHSTGRDHTAIGAYSAASSDPVTVVSCHGGGLEINKSSVVGQLKVTYSVHTQAGADPGGNTKDNQDAWCVQDRLGGQELILFGVFDGHGQEGKVVSNTVCQNIPKIMTRLVTGKPAHHVDSALSAAFPEANSSLKKKPGLDADLSGSTGIVAVISGNRLVAANLGDSRCVLGRVDGHGSVTAVALSSDHTPMDQQEANRIVASGGRIASFMCGEEPLGPPRVWLRDVNIPGLCMTRSFGDYVAASVGVIDQPQLIATPIKQEDRYVVLMSDGIFEFLDSQQVIDEVHAAAMAGQSPNEAAKRLVKMARKCWQEQEDEIIDDCTAMVVYLTPATAAATPSSSTGSAAAAAGSSSLNAATAALAARLERVALNSGVSKPGSAGVLSYKRS